MKVIKLEGLKKWLAEEGITTLVTCSHAPRTYFDMNNVNLFEVLGEMGIRVFLIDNDPFDGRTTLPLLRKILDAPRFSTWGILNKFWDSALDIKDATYTPILQDYNGGTAEAGKKIIICSRLRSAGDMEFDGDFIGTAWASFLADRRGVIRSDLVNSRKVSLMVEMFNNLNMALDAYKLKIVGWIRDKKNLEIYGDEAWTKFYPDNYRGWLSEEQYVAKLMEPNIFVLPNISPTYLDAFGPLFDMVRFGKKFLHPKVIDNNIQAFEFSCADELNDKLASFPRQTDEMATLKTVYQASVDSAVERITNGSD
jgi:hypothetical protein